MPTNLLHASAEWATRPDDERFWTLDEMFSSALQSCDESTQWIGALADIQFCGSDSEVGILLGEHQPDHLGVDPILMTNYAFGQMCRTLEAPASYLRSLPASTAAYCLGHGRQRWISANGIDATRQLLIHAGLGGGRLRAATSERYVRVWNHEIISRLLELQESGWRVPSARPVAMDSPRTRIAEEEDVIDYGSDSALTVKVGDVIGPAGLYASDHDMFAFLIHPDIEISDGESPGGLRRGTMIRQSEVGDCAIWKLDFLFNTVCGNHIVWGAENISETRVRHTGSEVGERWRGMVRAIDDYAQGSAADQEAKILEAKQTILGDDKESVIDFLFGKRLLGKRDAGDAFDMAERFESVHGNPRSAWGLVQGITRLSQATSHADRRATLDMTAGRVLAHAIDLN